MNYEHNKKILKIMGEYIERHPDERFFQILMNLNVLNFNAEKGIKNDYFINNQELLTKIENRLETLLNGEKD